MCVTIDGNQHQAMTANMYMYIVPVHAIISYDISKIHTA